MKTLFSIAFVALAAVAVSASGAHADNAAGSCNRIVANALNAAQACFNFECGAQECAEVTAGLFGFFSAPACAEGFTNGELEGLTNSAAIQPDGPNAGAAKHLADVVCTAVADCGLCGVAVSVGLGDCAGHCL